jgi:hypothetical protein
MLCQHIIVNVTSVIAPAYLIQAKVLSLNVDTPLSHFGTAFPFGLVCKMKDLKTCAGGPADHAQDHCTTPLPPHPLPVPVEHYSANDIPAEHPNLDHAPPDESFLLGSNLDYNPETDEDPNCAECDSTAEAQANPLADKLLQSTNDSGLVF